MLDRIVVPLDGSPLAESVLPQVRRIVAEGGEIVLVRAETPVPTESGAFLVPDVVAAAEKYLAGVQDRLREQGVRARVVARVGAAADVVLETVRESGAGLIAMATHGRGGAARLLLGSTAERILRESRVPVFLLRPFWSYELLPPGGPEAQPFRRILLPVDGSGLALCAAPAASAFAKRFGAEIVVLHVLQKGEDPTAVKAQLEDLKERFGIDGVRARTELERGDPAEAILSAAKSLKADLIALSTHGRSGLSRLVVGSVAEQVARRAESPLIVVRGLGAPRSRRKPAAKARK